MKKPPSFYDATYFGLGDNSVHKSNYQILNGYSDELAGSSEFVDWVLKQHPKPLIVLELGCAHGSGVREFRRRGVQAYGMDCSSYILSVAADDVKPYLYLCDMHVIPIDILCIAQFDVVCSKDVLEHSDEESIDALLIRLSQICRYQAHVINTGEYKHQIANGDLSHSLLRPLDWWKEKFNKLGIQGVVKAS